MCNAKKILLIEESEKIISEYEEFFKNDKSIQIVGKTYDGEKGIELIKSLDCDVIILELVLPVMDGFDVLDYLKDNNIDKKVIVTSSVKTNEITKRVNKYKVDYFLLKPYSVSKIKKVIDEFEDHEEDEDNELLVSIKNKLHDNGMQSSSKGYYYVRDAIARVCENPNYFRKVTTVLYPEISLKYDTTSSRVERLIRYAIDVSWLKGNMEVMNEIFRNSVDIDKGKPTNTEFIMTLAEMFRLEN